MSTRTQSALSATSDAPELIALLSELAARVQRARSVAGVLEAAGEGLGELGFTYGVSRLVGDELELLHVRNPPPLRRALEEFLGRPLEGFHGPVADELRDLWAGGKPLYSSEMLEAMALFFGMPAEATVELTATCAALFYGPMFNAPLTVRTRPWGLLSLCGESLTAGDVHAVGLFASHLSSAIEVAEAISGLERQNRELEGIQQIATAGADLGLEELVPRLLEIAARATDSDRAAIFLIEPQADRMRLVGTHGYVPALNQQYRKLPLTGSSAGAAAPYLRACAFSLREGWPEATRAEAAGLGLQTGAIVPVRLRGEPAGTLNLARTRPDPYEEDELELACRLAEHVAVQLDKARMQRDLTRRVEELSALQGLGALICEQLLDTSRILNTALRQVQRICDVSNVFVMLLDPAVRRLKMAASNRDDDETRSLEFGLDDHAAACEAVRTLRTVLIDDCLADPRAAKTTARRYGHRALLAVPLVTGSQAIGVMILGEDRGPRHFGPEESRLVEAVASQIAPALSNARLYQDLRESYGRLEHAQAELLSRERMAALGELAALVAHEVRNPLAVIFNSLASLSRLLKPEGDVRLLLGIVDEEATRLNVLVRDFLEFARPNEADIRPEPIEPLLQAAVEAATSAHGATGIRIRIEIAEGIAEVPLDGRLMRQAMVNLVTNGLQAMPRGGELLLRARHQAAEEEPELVVEVSDEGGGIPPSVRERLFQPFVTSKATGTGLGLAVVKRIVDAHGGRVHAESRPQGGTLFSLHLPAKLPVPASGGG